jgi:hypothetical protein
MPDAPGKTATAGVEAIEGIGKAEEASDVPMLMDLVDNAQS